MTCVQVCRPFLSALFFFLVIILFLSKDTSCCLQADFSFVEWEAESIQVHR